VSEQIGLSRFGLTKPHFGKVRITGHTDTIGSKIFNHALSLRRAEAVMQKLVEKGIPRTSIAAHGVGETDLLIKTGDNVRKRRNRRVSISVGPAR
jgi:OOP family OmpA-OmpF porin